MIIYIVFLSKRQELRKALEKPTEPIDEKVKKMENLLNLDDLSLNNERLKVHTDLFKHSLRNQFRSIW